MNAAQVASICIGGSLLLLVILVLCIWIGSRCRQQHYFAKLSQSAARNQYTSPPTHTTNLVTSPTVDHKVSSHGDYAWEKTSPCDHIPSRRWRTRDSTASLRTSRNIRRQRLESGVPLRQLSQNRVDRQKFPAPSHRQRHTSVTVENGKNRGNFPALHPKIDPKNKAPERFADGLSSTVSNNEYPGTKIFKSTTPDNSPTLEVSPSAALRPKPLFAGPEERHRSVQAASQPGRSYSVPSTLMTEKGRPSRDELKVIVTLVL